MSPPLCVMLLASSLDGGKKKRGSGGNLQAIRLSFSQEAMACCNIVQALPVALLCVTNNGRIEETASYIFLKRLTGCI